MGNYLSCTMAKVPGGKGARVILPDDGGVRQVALPATAAELMMDAPGHFLADARAARVGARLAALSADEELELGAVYATFPMKRLGTPLAPADMARLAAVATREARRSAKVAAAVVAPPPTPLQAEDAAPRLRLDEMVDDEAVAADMNVYKHRLSSARSRRPTLETIQEENYMSTN
ncbi:hypothetical protein EE612_031048 [Oryza sativa]|uniref:Uncharacterized protein n=4 Tax=Oryza TaxID=4527 RepID=B8AWF6_ORYSI|nr:uncharacterized protein LOC127774430 [Oryza glaberrima]EEC79660.1 hypothetical protein OsI_20903 [Oryza sativa Indica Group]KAB8100497.1 hypothetical protein EE612_031048 [Oryza sativa]